ncbi:hypothetical protein ACJX0J_022393, partial [Zea mays]
KEFGNQFLVNNSFLLFTFYCVGPVTWLQNYNKNFCDHLSTIERIQFFNYLIS